MDLYKDIQRIQASRPAGAATVQAKAPQQNGSQLDDLFGLSLSAPQTSVLIPGMLVVLDICPVKKFSSATKVEQLT